MDLNNKKTIMLLNLLNQAKIYRTYIHIWVSDCEARNYIDKFAYRLDIYKNDKIITILSTYEKNITASETTPIQLNDVFKTYINSDKYLFYYTNQQMVANFLDEHWDHSPNPNLILANNMIKISDIETDYKIHSIFKKLLKTNKPTSQLHEFSDIHPTKTQHQTQRYAKLKYISIIKYIGKQNLNLYIR